MIQVKGRVDDNSKDALMTMRFRQYYAQEDEDDSERVVNVRF